MKIPAGEFQIMSAGTGIRHSEYNPNSTERLHLYQIWIMPEENGITPRYEQRRFDAVQGKQLVLSPDARDGSLKVHQDMELYRWALLKDEQSVHQIAAERRVWIQVLMLNSTFQHVGQNFHIFMRVSAEALPCFNHVVVNHAQRGEAHKVRIVIVGKRESMPGVQPAMICMTTFICFAEVDHLYSPPE